MALLSWLNADKFDALRDKVNAAIAMLNSLGKGSGNSSAVNDVLVPIGGLVSYFRTAPPNSSWLLCQGQAISRTTYSDLFGVIGVSFGSGDGSTTFNLPDLRGRFLVGYDPGDSDYNNITSAKIGGEKTHTLSTSELPSVSNSFNEPYIGGSGWVGGNSGAGSTYDIRTHNINFGSGTAHENRPPYVTINYIIRAL